jgi:hypothetical protein
VEGKWDRNGRKRAIMERVKKTNKNEKEKKKRGEKVRTHPRCGFTNR